jgi:molybdate transport system regulatory protein
MHVHAAVSFENKRSIAGRGRIRLLEAVGREGSISAAARATGLSYKAAWDAIEGLNTLFGRALVEARSGGARGGGTQLTKSGIQVVETLTRLEGELSRALLRLEPDLRGNGIAVSNLVPGFLLRTSARNALRGVITSIKTDAVSADITLAVAPRTSLRAIITRRSVEELGLCPGRDALALVKASLISITKERDARNGKIAGNRIAGRLIRKELGQHDTELAIDVGAGETLVATIRTSRLKTMRLKKLDEVWAAFDPRHVILAVG